MKKVLVLAVALTLVLGASAFATIYTGFNSFSASPGWNGSVVGGSSIRTGYWGSGAAWIMLDSTDFVATWTITARSQGSGYYPFVKWNETALVGDGAFNGVGGYNALINDTGPWYAGTDPAGWIVNPVGPTTLAWNTGQPPMDGGPSETFTLTCLNGVSTLSANDWGTIWTFATPRTGKGFMLGANAVVCDFSNLTICTTPIPEPGSIVCLLTGLTGLVAFRRKRA